ncbi:MAG: DNA-3-methyladenine glycosylase 2 family protein [Actinobacteria bacterium]|nr:DNA-3-methyladenine glycosylase 2 family protein [Actinomycetota bacterium]
MPSRTFDAAAPVDLAATLGPQRAAPDDPAFRLAPAEAWVAIRLPSGPAAIRFRADGTRLEAEAWGEGAAEALDRAPGIVGAGDDPAGFDPAERPLRDLARRHAGLRITRSGAVADMAVRAAVGQRVTGKEARRSYSRLAAALGEPAPGPQPLTLPPDPRALAGLGYPSFHPFGIERGRAETIIRIGRHARRLDEAASLPRDEAGRRIRAVRGVGPWSEALVATTALGDADAVLVGDDNLPNAVAWLLAGEPRADDERMLELLEPYRGHRARVIRLVQASGRKAPRYGPRRPLRSIEGI